MSSAAGRAGVSVVRLSGPAALDALAALAPSLTPRPRMAHRVKLVDPGDASTLDEAIALAFPGPASFTGEDVVELQVHGSPAVLDRLFAVLRGLGLRAARPGEFTRRSFAHGKMDLSAAEGLADLISADSDSQRRQALAQLGGAWAERIEAWQARLLDALAWLEAAIDFADEDDVPADVDDRAPEIAASVADEIAEALRDGRRGEIIREGLRVVILGPPNVGKSTLLNALAGREAAIVSDIPGTTRDLVEIRLDVDGYVLVVTDTAGLRATTDPIEAEGVRRARIRAAEADVRVWVLDVGGSQSADRVGLETDPLWRPTDLVFWNKADSGAPLAGEEGDLFGSALVGQGVDHLLKALTARLGGASEPSLITRARHREALTAALSALRRVDGGEVDLAAEDIRSALQELARIVGRFDVEAVLDRVFSAFCIGK